MKKLKKIIRYIPLWVKVIFGVFLFSVLLHFCFMASAGFAEMYINTVGHFVRTILSAITNFIPVSLAEASIIFVPFIFFVIAVMILRVIDDDRDYVRLLSGIMSIVLIIYSVFVFSFAAGFYTKGIGEYYGEERRKISVNELHDATEMIVSELNAAYSEIEGKGAYFTSMGMGYKELSNKLLDGFSSIEEKYGYPNKLKSRIKPVVLSEPMTYTHISGIYSFFTGEANVNVNYPDFVIPYTAAHEMSHQRGVSREDEANFVAFLVCAESDDPYIRYSGYLNMYQYMSNALYSSSHEKYMEIYEMLDIGIRRELSSYSSFFDKYRDNVAADVSDAVNDSYLTVMSGTDSRSYGMVVDLVTVYIISDKTA